jgi:hypothetical protein
VIVTSVGHDLKIGRNGPRRRFHIPWIVRDGHCHWQVLRLVRDDGSTFTRCAHGVAACRKHADPIPDALDRMSLGLIVSRLIDHCPWCRVTEVVRFTTNIDNLNRGRRPLVSYSKGQAKQSR